jgi:hypothetical protein
MTHSTSIVRGLFLVVEWEHGTRCGSGCTEWNMTVTTASCAEGGRLAGLHLCFATRCLTTWSPAATSWYATVSLFVFVFFTTERKGTQATVDHWHYGRLNSIRNRPASHKHLAETEHKHTEYPQSVGTIKLDMNARPHRASAPSSQRGIHVIPLFCTVHC